eukprot:10788384-Karenia_brevis.AAC.1
MVLPRMGHSSVPHVDSWMGSRCAFEKCEQEMRGYRMHLTFEGFEEQEFYDAHTCTEPDLDLDEDSQGEVIEGEGNEGGDSE